MGMDSKQYGVFIVDSLAQHSTERYRKRPLSAIDLIVVHHSAGPPSIGPGRIAKMHVAKDWPGIGYHYVVTADGTVVQTNELETHSYHAVGSNWRSVGICFLGSFMDAPPPDRQIKAGAGLCAWLLEHLDLSANAIFGHGELMPTACPGRQWLDGVRWKDALLQSMAAAVGIEAEK